jgi:hypothetical protein
MKELKICVERVVRPIRATPRRKDRMREELLAHLTATYEEELARDDDPKAALDRAVVRFGKPNEVRRELQESVPAAERILHSRLPLPSPVERWDAKWLTESPGWYAFRVAVAAFVVLILMGTLTPILLTAAGRAHAPLPELLRFGLSVEGVAAVWPFFFLLCWGKFRDAVCGSPSKRARILRAAGWAALMIPVTLACGAGVYALAPRRLLHFQLTGRSLMFVAIYTLLTPLLVTFFGLLAAREQRRYEEWGSLTIE